MVRKVQLHRKAGVCIAIVGFLPLFAGIMMVAVSNTASEKSDKTMKGLGPTCLAIGLAFIFGGFLYQFIKHKLWKSKLQEQPQGSHIKYRSSRPGSATSSNSRTKIIARSSIEEPFDDLHVIQETQVVQDTVEELQYAKSNSSHKKQSKAREEADVRKVRTIEDEIKEMHQQQGACAASALPDRDIIVVGAADGHTHASLPGSMYNLHDSD